MNPAFEQFASSRGYSIAPAVLPSANRVYADSQTQEVYEAWCDGVAHGSRDVSRGMVEGLSPEQLAAAGIV
jgi:hypothetical protein